MALERHEEIRIQEIEGIAQAYAQSAKDHVRFRPEEIEGKIYAIDHGFPAVNANPVFALIYLLSYALKLGVLIFNKLDNIHTLLWEQELRERNKEGR
jgi:hypothetical protein